MKICGVGLGRIGTPLAAQFAAKGHHVVGVDVNPRIVDHLNAGTEPFPGETGLADALAAAHAAGTLRATTDHADAVPGADAVVIVVPLLVDEQTWLPDFSIMDAATAQVAASLTAGTLVSYETTLPVGTTRHRWRPLLEQGSGLVEGTDFHVVFFGESAVRSVVSDAFALVDEAAVVVVLGSSLTVMSGLRFVRHAARYERPVAIVNRGATRGDDLARLRVEAGVGEGLTLLRAGLTDPRGGDPTT